MRCRIALYIFCVLVFVGPVQAASNPHLVVFGKWMPVRLFVGPDETSTIEIKVRSLYIDGRLREFTTGEPHDVTDRLFVVRRAYRVNDWLPQDEGTPHKWRWQRGGWLLVDRNTGRLSALQLPYFEPFCSVAAWYRDYVAYCGVSDDGEKLFAMVTQLGRKKALLRHELGPVKDSALPDSQCPAPLWQRQPVRVSFQPAGGQKLTFAVRGHAADLAAAPEGDEEKQ